MGSRLHFFSSSMFKPAWETSSMLPESYLLTQNFNISYTEQQLHHPNPNQLQPTGTEEMLMWSLIGSIIIFYLYLFQR